jgi:hypothetical protein
MRTDRQRIARASASVEARNDVRSAVDHERASVLKPDEYA